MSKMTRRNRFAFWPDFLSSLCSARDALKQCLPEALRDNSFTSVLRTEEAVQRWLALLMKNIGESGASGSTAGTGTSFQSLDKDGLSSPSPPLMAGNATTSTSAVLGGSSTFSIGSGTVGSNTWNPNPLK